MLEQQVPRFPSTRYQGSKTRLVPWLMQQLSTIEFDTVLDAFGGTGVVGWHLKLAGKQVTYNDALTFNAHIGRALIENDEVRLSEVDLDGLLGELGDEGHFITETFEGIYFTDEENRWLDAFLAKLQRMPASYGRDLVFAALCQACLIKRPYNLFHRRNLAVRTRDVERSFGNKTTWDRPFEDYIRRFGRELSAAVFKGRRPCTAVCRDVSEVEGDFDLVYLDPPYVPRRGIGVNYRRFYHFLEGLADPDTWAERIDWSSKHRELTRTPSPWCDRARVAAAFESVFDRYEAPRLAISYRSDGVPSIEDLESSLRRRGRTVTVHRTERFQYALSKNRRSHEVLLLAR